MSGPVEKNRAIRCPVLLACLLIVIATVCISWIMSPIPRGFLPPPRTVADEIARALGLVLERGIPAIMLLGCAGVVGGYKTAWSALQVGLGLCLLFGIWYTVDEMLSSGLMLDPVSTAFGFTVTVIFPLSAVCYLRFSGAVRRYAQRNT